MAARRPECPSQEADRAPAVGRFHPISQAGWLYGTMGLAATSSPPQHFYTARIGWGLPAARALGPVALVVAVVDVLSFTTTVTVAVASGIEVFPYQWADDSAAAFARKRDAVLAVGRSQAGHGEVSLSPDTLQNAPEMHRLVLPSPNGSAITHALSGTAKNVIAISLRNRSAAASWTVERLICRDRLGQVAVIAAGEHWRDGSLRPAVEDLWSAGGYLSALEERGVRVSPEAAAAVAALRAASHDIPGRTCACESGREIIDAGYRRDVEVAAAMDTDSAVPLLRGGRFIPIR